ncbi:MAG: hypothetical protein MZV63_07315 [Marinilabiliales bacterium]|nr:hypothetical protein [Marinilabiliales bacterium]
MDPKIGAKITAKNPVFGVGVIPAGTYGRQKNDVLVLQTGNIMLTNANIHENVIYELTKSIFKNLEALYAAHPRRKY